MHEMGLGIHVSANFPTPNPSNSRSLASAVVSQIQSRITVVRNAPSRLMMPRMAWWSRYLFTTPPSHLTSLATRFALAAQKGLPHDLKLCCHAFGHRDTFYHDPPLHRLRPQMLLQPRKLKISGLPRVWLCRFRGATRQNSMSRVLSGRKAKPNFSNRPCRAVRNGSASCLCWNPMTQSSA